MDRDVFKKFVGVGRTTTRAFFATLPSATGIVRSKWNAGANDLRKYALVLQKTIRWRPQWLYLLPMQLVALSAIVRSGFLVRTTSEFLKASSTGVAALVAQDPIVVLLFGVLITAAAVLVEHRAGSGSPSSRCDLTHEKK
jgi:hypothetical protein